MKSSSIQKLLGKFVLTATSAAALVAGTGVAQNLPCIDTDGIKFIRQPQLDGGLDVRDSQGNIVLADDFLCTTNGPITDIHIWGSWLGNNHVLITNFWLGIYNDVPAVTNFASGIVTNSHPGTNLLWRQSFGPLQYSETVFSTGPEQFYDPQSHTFIGTDNTNFYYCFYPTNPFVQQGSVTTPTNYWLAVRAQFSSPTAAFGWKTAQVPYNDPAVWGPVQPATGLPIGIWQSITNPQTLQPIHLSMMLTTPTNSPPPECCPNTNGMKYLQRPNVINGIDIDVSDNFVLADDFPCTNTGPITDIHLWGSWLLNNVDPNVSYTLTIWSDVPVSPGNTYSHPGINLWSQTFGPNQYNICPYANIFELFDYNTAASGLTTVGSSSNLYYLCFFMDPANTFTQTGTLNVPTNYWLSVSVQSPAGTGKSFGWKSSMDSYNDAAVWGSAPLPPPTGWNKITDNFGNRFDLAFKITTQTNPPGTTGCVETNGTKYVQWPNLNQGFDVWDDGPWVLADDFICTNAGPVSDIHIWGSWLNDQMDTNLLFWLAIYDDVQDANGSHPGNLLWNEQFAPGRYFQSFWSFGQESFLDPGPPVIIGTDTQVWYYCFYPTNIFVQQGGPGAAAKTYWLMVYAQETGANLLNYGWKTTTNVQHDVSVHTPWPGSPPPIGAPWTKTQQASTGGSLDLAFKITTVTNSCPITFICQPDQTVECGSAWNFNPPGVLPSTCCPNPPPPTLIGVVTNESNPCKNLYTATWQITNCLGVVVGTCSQTVTVQDTAPPVITCPSNIVVFTCDSNVVVSWTVTASDTCSSVTVTSTPPSGSTFFANTTNTVTATARDACGNTNICTFTVAVRRPVLGPIFISRLGTNKVVLTWTNGILQVSTNFTLFTTNVAGPYVDVPGATSPYTNDTFPPVIKFYRLRCNSP